LKVSKSISRDILDKHGNKSITTQKRPNKRSPATSLIINLSLLSASGVSLGLPVHVSYRANSSAYHTSPAEKEQSLVLGK
jgi:hypothetical protein